MSTYYYLACEACGCYHPIWRRGPTWMAADAAGKQEVQDFIDRHLHDEGHTIEFVVEDDARMDGWTREPPD